MEKLLTRLARAFDARLSTRRVVLFACALALSLSAGNVALANPSGFQIGRQQQQSDKQKPAPSEDDDDEDEGESEGTSQESARARPADPAAAMRNARYIFVRSNSEFVSEREVEDALRKRKEIKAWGMIITRNESEADLIIEISRKAFTRRFTFTVVEPRTWTLVTSGKTRSVLFGKKIPNKIAEKFANRVKVVRPYPPVAGQTP